MSIIIPFGIRTMGWCDYFEDESGHEMCVATQFFHIFFIPLVPLSSMLCVDADEAPCGGCCGARGVQMPMYWKCWGWAFLRFICLGLLWFYKPKANCPEEILEMAFGADCNVRVRHHTKDEEHAGLISNAAGREENV
eukprot:TRINITY_DN6721_c0_g1_i1.p1 TRINITY_DN6721_c0_g1~~TRINITY_DN6721_c0_g1_i1.p1  ORF type:complete len:137 (-),score=12.15 TRINITY_DN6721_c0_g1_i1:117-527(-)